jgi:thiamine-monophosphate kinase
VAAASGVCLDLTSAALAADVVRLEPAVGTELARDCVLGGGEEHSLLATFPTGSAVPEGFRVIGDVVAGSGTALDGIPQQPRGWDHFAG